MKSETEIKQKLEYYEQISSGFQAGGLKDNPRLFMLICSKFPKETMELLTSPSMSVDIMKRLPPEDQPWVRQWLETTTKFAEQVLEARINMLKWVLEMDAGAGGVTREGV